MGHCGVLGVGMEICRISEILDGNTKVMGGGGVKSLMKPFCNLQKSGVFCVKKAYAVLTIL